MSSPWYDYPLVPSSGPKRGPPGALKSVVLNGGLGLPNKRNKLYFRILFRCTVTWSLCGRCKPWRDGLPPVSGRGRERRCTRAATAAAGASQPGLAEKLTFPHLELSFWLFKKASLFPDNPDHFLPLHLLVLVVFVELQKIWSSNFKQRNPISSKFQPCLSSARPPLRGG